MIFNTIFQTGHNILESKVAKWCMLLCYSLIVGILKYYHIFERDESQVLLIVNFSENFRELFSSFAYEGTTGLWHVFLWLCSHIIEITPDSVSIIHFIIVVFFAWFLLFKVEVPVIFKIIFLAQLSILWYSLSVRQYILVPLFLATFIYSIQQKKIWVASLSVFLLMQVHVTAIPVALALWVYYLGTEILKSGKLFRPAYILPLAGLILAFFQLYPPQDLIEGLKEWKPVSFSAFITANDLVLSEMLGTRHIWFYFALILLFVAYLLRKSANYHTGYLFIWVVAFLGCYLSYVYIGVAKYLVVKHYQLLYYLLLAFLVLVSDELKLRFRKVWYVILIPLFIYASYKMKAQVADYLYAPFSYAKEVAGFLDSDYPERTVLIKPETHYNSVRVYRKKDSPVFALGRNEYTEYPVWNHHSIDHKVNKRFLPVHLSDLRQDLIRCPDSLLRQQPLIVIGSEMMKIFINDMDTGSDNQFIKIGDGLTLKRIRTFDGPSLNYLTERFIIFEVNDAGSNTERTQ